MEKLFLGLDLKDTPHRRQTVLVSLRMQPTFILAQVPATLPLIYSTKSLQIATPKNDFKSRTSVLEVQKKVVQDAVG